MGYTNCQLRKIAVVYDSIARLLPTEGRDYKMSIKFKGDGNAMVVSMKPYTEIGKIWCDYCMKSFKKSWGMK